MDRRRIWLRVNRRNGSRVRSKLVVTPDRPSSRERTDFHIIIGLFCFIFVFFIASRTFPSTSRLCATRPSLSVSYRTRRGPVAPRRRRRGQMTTTRLSRSVAHAYTQTNICELRWTLPAARPTQSRPSSPSHSTRAAKSVSRSNLVVGERSSHIHTRPAHATTSKQRPPPVRVGARRRASPQTAAAASAPPPAAGRPSAYAIAIC